MKLAKGWRRHTAQEYAALFPARPKALRKMAFGLRKLGAGNQPFTMNERKLAEACGVSRTTLKRYLWLFESYGILEVKRWRYRQIGPSPNTYRVYLGNVIPENYRDRVGDYPISARETARNNPLVEFRRE